MPPIRRDALLLGHGAGGGVVESPDLVAARDAALADGVTVGLVEQPYRVAGRGSPAPAGQLDTAWLAVVARLREQEPRGFPLLVGGRSLGARVACRTAEAVGAVGVVCLAFPLQPPRRSGKAPAPSRLPELDAVTVPTLVVQGVLDPFGMPPASKTRTDRRSQSQGRSASGVSGRAVLAGPDSFALSERHDPANAKSHALPRSACRQFS